MNLKKSKKSGLNKLHLLAIIEVSEMRWNLAPPPKKKILYEFEFHLKNRHNAKLNNKYHFRILKAHFFEEMLVWGGNK